MPHVQEYLKYVFSVFLLKSFVCSLLEDKLENKS